MPEATPKTGVIKVGEVCRTARPVPVIGVENRAPPEVDWTKPAVKEDRVVEPVADNVPVMEEEAKKLVPLTVKPVEEALPKEAPVSQE